MWMTSFQWWSGHRSQVNKLSDHLNSRYNNIQLTVEVEQDGRLPVMDVLLNSEDNGEVNATIYRESRRTWRGTCLLALTTVFGWKNRWFSRLCIGQTMFQKERRLEKNGNGTYHRVLEENGYPSSCLEIWTRRSLESEGKCQCVCGLLKV